MPGAMIAIARMNIPSIFIYGGTIKPGKLNGEDLTVVSAFEAVGQLTSGKINEKRLIEVEKIVSQELEVVEECLQLTLCLPL